ncbi:MAG: hypothetical protein H6741_17705 [Alphaproteobacteria bacterium]|nr:hypothetical protein [Alphaproteobacteria bacterium]MCB9794555.1 hypothetical protein [Alphaproteobacteria bacterium]
MSRFRDAVELGLAVALTASTFSTLLVLTALHGPPELPVIAPPEAPRAARFVLPTPAGPEAVEAIEVADNTTEEREAKEAPPEAAPRAPDPPKSNGEALPVPRTKTALDAASRQAAGAQASKGRGQRCLTPPSEIRSLADLGKTPDLRFDDPNR